MTGLVAVVAAFIGAAGAGIPAFIVAQGQIQAANDLQRSTFFRDQRQQVYTQFIAAEARLALKKGILPSPDGRISSQPRVGSEQDFVEIDNLIASIGIVGSTKAYEVAYSTRLYYTEIDTQNRRLLLAAQNLKETPAGLQAPATADEIRRIRYDCDFKKGLAADHVQALMIGFTKDARRELGLPED